MNKKIREENKILVKKVQSEIQKKDYDPFLNLLNTYLHKMYARDSFSKLQKVLLEDESFLEVMGNIKLRNSVGSYHKGHYKKLGGEYLDKILEENGVESMKEFMEKIKPLYGKKIGK